MKATCAPLVFSMLAVLVGGCGASDTNSDGAPNGGAGGVGAGGAGQGGSTAVGGSGGQAGSGSISEADLAAVGLLYGVKPDGTSAPICTGTLIGPHTVLTAGHCVKPKSADKNIIDSAPVFFALGVDSQNPEQTIRAVWGAKTEVAGHDVGVYQLAEEPAGIQPIQVADAPLTTADIGAKLVAGGYGVRDTDDTWLDFLTRRTGELSVTTFDPQPLHVLFPNFADFQAFLEENAGKPFPTSVVQNSYDDTLLTANDVFVGAPGEMKLAFLDSGGPGLDLFDGKPRLRAVHSRSLMSDPTATPTGVASEILPAGSAFAMLGAPGTQQMITQALSDPCRGVPSAGFCSASTLIRCEGSAISLEECADSGKTCSALSGVFGCH